MTNDNLGLIKSLKEMTNDKSFASDIAAIKSKALLKELSEEYSNTVKWRFDELQIVKNITAASFITGAVAFTAPGKFRASKLSPYNLD